MAQRKITFRNVGKIGGAQAWRNAETGVEIRKSGPGDGGVLHYTVTVAGRDMGEAVMSWSAPTLAGAREYALTAAEAFRVMVDRARTEALIEDSDRATAIIIATLRGGEFGRVASPRLARFLAYNEEARRRIPDESRTAQGTLAAMLRNAAGW